MLSNPFLEEEEDVMCAIGRVLPLLTIVANLNGALEHLLKMSHDAIEALVSLILILL